MGLCAEGPLVSTSSGVLYKKVAASAAAAVLDSLEGPAVAAFALSHGRSLLSAPEKDRAGELRRRLIPSGSKTTSRPRATPR